MKIKLLFLLLSLNFIGSLYSMNPTSNEMLIRGAKDGDIKLVQEALGLHAKDQSSYVPSILTRIKRTFAGNIKIIPKTLEYTANIDFQDEYGYTALMHAIINKHESIVELLLDKGANPDIRNDKGQTALMYAVSNPKSYINNIVRLLLDKGANLDIRDRGGDTALMIAAVYSLKDIVQLLLDRGANPDIQDNNGSTALMHAALFGEEADYVIAKLLLNSGASLDLANKDGETALDIAKRKKYKSMADLIEHVRRERFRQETHKEIVESGYLLPELAEIVSEYAIYPKQKQT